MFWASQSADALSIESSSLALEFLREIFEVSSNFLLFQLLIVYCFVICLCHVLQEVFSCGEPVSMTSSSSLALSLIQEILRTSSQLTPSDPTLKQHSLRVTKALRLLACE